MNKAVKIIMIAGLAGAIFTGCSSSSEVTSETVAVEIQDENQSVVEEMLDGEYYAEESEYSYGYKGTMKIVVADGLISEVVYADIDENGNKKSENEEYNKKYMDKSGISFEEVSTTLRNQLLETQDLDKIDVVAGATTSSEKFVKLGKEALGK
ncbi:MAG: FMN-binding protein [Firmicutes bacterium]|nr:FMN-binding protein [Bacillota bacterium]